MTGVFKGRAERLTCDVLLIPFHKGDTPKRIASKDRFKAEALFDTGATRSVISVDTAREMRLIPVGECSVGTAGGRVLQPIHMVHFMLPNQILISSLEVTAAPLPGVDALIGMDIISLGDFAVTHHRGDTVCSFQIPSTHCIDFSAG
jgi:predicted aspartyl protease